MAECNHDWVYIERRECDYFGTEEKPKSVVALYVKIPLGEICFYCKKCLALRRKEAIFKEVSADDK